MVVSWMGVLPASEGQYLFICPLAKLTWFACVPHAEGLSSFSKRPP